METVSNLTSAATSAASRAIWGDPNKESETTQSTNEEPISGETGDVSAGEPYDKGNDESTSTTKKDTITSPSNTTTPASDITTTIPIRTEQATSKTGVTSLPNPTSTTSSDPPSVIPPKDTTEQQGADKPTAAPAEGSEEHAKIVETKKEAEEAAKLETSGPGPKPLSEIRDSATPAEDGPQKESQGKGTGEQYVKSSGLKADGGDFDASKPGAAKEADRLLQTKGVHHEATVAGESKVETGETSESPSGGKLKGLKEKIKAKLHKN